MFLIESLFLLKPPECCLRCLHYSVLLVSHQRATLRSTYGILTLRYPIAPSLATPFPQTNPKGYEPCSQVYDSPLLTLLLSAKKHLRAVTRGKKGFLWWKRWAKVAHDICLYGSPTRNQRGSGFRESPLSASCVTHLKSLAPRLPHKKKYHQPIGNVYIAFTP